ncbi:MAG TPA: TraB/GumN family protein, partial [Alphaproteobacteria bacterium]|nr:TraB/GumN family protein [Alphaproteobacteria bacterium]
AADTFVFEAALDDPVAQQQLQMLVAQKGFLPPGQSLHAMLTPEAQAELDEAIAAARIAPEFIDRERPWLAALQLTIARLGQQKFGAENGVDKAVMAVASAAAKPERYFETLEEQLALFAPADPKLELAEFQSDIADIKNLPDEVEPLFDAWARGDADKIDELMNGEMNDRPEAKTALIDDRNKRWLVKIEAMLKEKHAFFITVGAGHLAGPGSVPNLLRKAGYEVDGP